MTTKTKKKNKKRRKKIDWNEQFEKLTQYCKKNYGYEVKKESREERFSVFLPSTKEIIIHNKHKPESCFYYLLHEAGHMILQENTKDYEQKLGFVYENFSLSSLASKTAEVEEEFEAWKIGLKLAKKLKLKINRKSYEQLKATDLSSYFIWAVERKIRKQIQEALTEADKEYTQRRKKRTEERASKKTRINKRKTENLF